ncbi:MULTISPECIES: conjugative transposon protein TraM [unclassified Carboxylicivirga]|uniref:conjugative transposon protein TraM n=1 Tax=Carboxylicivirga TaxID=1628153 RepID=UPI003D341175
MKTQIKTNKALFILPLGLLPFVVLIFYILGGASGQNKQTTPNDNGGANYQLPDANRNIAIMDKQEAYEQISAEEPQKPVKLNIDTTQVLTPLEVTEKVPAVNVNEVLLAHVKRQEQLSRQALQNQTQGIHQKREESLSEATKTHSQISGNSVRRQVRKQTIKRTSPSKVSMGDGSSIELEELTELVDAHERLMQQNDSLSRQLHQAQIIVNQQSQKQTFFEVQILSSGGFEPRELLSSSIKAQVVEDSKVLSGNRVMLRLLNDTYINGKIIPTGTLIYGLCKTDNERLQLLVCSVPYQDEFLPVSLSAYDLDGIRGLYVPDNVNLRVYKDVAGDVNPSILMTPSDNPLSYMGVSAAADLSKTMIKRVKLKRVYLRKNTVLILKND